MKINQPDIQRLFASSHACGGRARVEVWWHHAVMVSVWEEIFTFHHSFNYIHLGPSLGLPFKTYNVIGSWLDRRDHTPISLQPAHIIQGRETTLCKISMAEGSREGGGGGGGHQPYNHPMIAAVGNTIRAFCQTQITCRFEIIFLLHSCCK